MSITTQPLWESSVKLIDAAIKHRRVTGICSRQTGKTHTLAKIAVDEAKKEGTQIVVVTHGIVGVRHFQEILQQALIENNILSQAVARVGRIEFDNGSVIRMVSGKQVLNHGLRGCGFNVLLVDDSAYVDGLAEYLSSDIEPILNQKKNSLIVSVSSVGPEIIYYPANSHMIKNDWRTVTGRDEAWKADMIKYLGEEVFLIEHENKHG